MAEKTKAQLQAEIVELRKALDVQTDATTAISQRLTNQGAVGQQTTWSEIMVGIRNISENTLGLVSPFKHEADVQLYADVAGPNGEAPVGHTAVISYAWWRQLRSGTFTQQGQLVRDDTVLGAGMPQAPTDLEKDLPKSFYLNAIEDPEGWIKARTEEQIRQDLKKMTYEGSLYRIRNVVDRELSRLENKMPRSTLDEQVVAAEYALQTLSGKLQLVDRVTTDLLLAKAETGDSSVKKRNVQLR